MSAIGQKHGPALTLRARPVSLGQGRGGPARRGYPGQAGDAQAGEKNDPVTVPGARGRGRVAQRLRWSSGSIDLLELSIGVISDVAAIRRPEDRNASLRSRELPGIDGPHLPQVQRGPAADDFLNTRVISGCLSSFGLFAGLFLDLPVREWVLVLASRALPCTFRRIRTTFMKHLDDQMAMQTHRGLAINHVFSRFCKFRHKNLPHLF